MEIFRLQKWYYDCLIPDQLYMFTYFARIKLYGYSENVLHLFVTLFERKEKIARICRMSEVTDSLRIDSERIKSTTLAMGRSENTNTLKINLPGIHVNLLYKPQQIPACGDCCLAIKAGGKDQQITWQPLHLKSEVSGKLRIGAYESQLVKASGYIDQLLSNVFPLRAPVHRLYWGRVHHPRINFVYTLSFGKKTRQEWHCIIIQDNGSPCQLMHPKIRFSDGKSSNRILLNYHETLEINAQDTLMTLRITIRQKEIVSASDFIHEDNDESILKTRFLSYISKNPRGLKFLSFADIEITHKHRIEHFTQIPCISEVVQFN